MFADKSSKPRAGKMLKFIWGRGQGPTAERLKLQKELFNFSKNITYGFPHKPTCIGWDPELRLVAVTTRCASNSIKVNMTYLAW